MRVLIPLAEGVEEMECVILLDVLRRAEIESVGVAMGNELQVTGAHGINLMADTSWPEIDPASFDMIAIPGGMGGTRRLQQDKRLLQTIRDFADAGKPLAAVCAGPLVLQSAGVLEGRTVTCHPGVADELTVPQRIDEHVVTDGNLITSQAPGTSFNFALAIVARLVGQKVADEVAEGLVLKR